MRCLACLLALLAAPAAAQPVALGEYPAIQTRFGTLSVVPVSQWENGLFLNGTGQPLAANRRVSLRGAFARGDEAQDWALVETNHGGNMCPTSYVLLRLSARGIARTGEFGDCLGRIREVRLAPGRIEVDIEDPDIRIDLQRFTFDGAQLSVAQIAPANVPTVPAGAGPDVTRWLAQHAGAIFDDASEQARFDAIMPRSEFEHLRRRVAVGGKPVQRGNWVFGAGCMAHQCNAVAGFWGLRIADGAPVAVLLDRGQPPRYFGRADVLADPAVAGFIAERAFR